MKHRQPPRFRIKIADWVTAAPVVLADRTRPAYRQQFATMRAACLAMDNTVRRELGMPERFDITAAEIRDAMGRAS